MIAYIKKKDNRSKWIGGSISRLLDTVHGKAFQHEVEFHRLSKAKGIETNVYVPQQRKHIQLNEVISSQLFGQCDILGDNF